MLEGWCRVEFIVGFGVLVDAAVLIWLIISVRQIKEQLRRIAISLPVSDFQMKLINRSISTKDAMQEFEGAGGKFLLVRHADGSHHVKLVGAADPELCEILQARTGDVLGILLAKKK